MSSAYTKQKLKQSREAIAKKDWDAASSAAKDVLEHEPDNYNANVFLGLSLLQQEKYDESESAYIKATKDQPTQLLAWQGLQKFYEERKTWDKLRSVLHTLMDLYNDAGEAAKLAEVYQRLLALEREEGGKKSTLETLALLLPDSKYYSTLSSLDVPDQTQPEKTSTFETQMSIHVRSLDVLQEMVELAEKWEADFIQKESEKRRMRLDGAKKGKEALTNEVRMEVYSQSRLPALYEQILSHPKAEDALRTETEAKLLRHRLSLLTSFPPKQLSRGFAPTGTAAVDTKAQAAKDEAEEERQQGKQALRDEILRLASGMVIIGLADELPWEIELEWGRPTTSLADLNFEQLRKFISLFPRSGRTKAFRALLLFLQDPQYLAELKEEEKRTDTEIVHPRTQEDLLNLAIDGLEESPNSTLAHSIAATFYLLDHDYQSASEVAHSALQVIGRLENETEVNLDKSRLCISAILLTALTHLHPPQHHAKASRLIDTVLQADSKHIDALLAKANIEQHAGRWQSAKDLFSQVQSVVATSDTHSQKHTIQRNLSLTQDPDQEAQIEIAWCDVQLGNLENAKGSMEGILSKIDPISYDGATAELRAKVWYRLGQCFWYMGSEYLSDPQYAFTAFITALKRNPAYAPAYTSLGLYYSDVLSPPDLTRSSKCFQKAFELSPLENVAARRLAEGFAEEREWDLVEVVARRTIEGEGGAAALSSAGRGVRHLSQNSWAWKAIGNVEINNKKFEEAILALQIALRSDSEDSSAWQRLGEAYTLAGRHVAALKCFAKALELIEADPETQHDGWHTRYSIGDVHLQLGNFDTAIQIFDSVLEGHPDEVGVAIALANAHLFASRQEYSAGYVQRAEESAFKAITGAGRVLLVQDQHLRSVWKILSDAVFHLSRFGVLRNTTDSLNQEHGLLAILDLAKQLGTDEKLPSINVVTHSKLNLTQAKKGVQPFEMLQASVYLYKLRVVLTASDDKVAGSGWADLATALYLYSRMAILPASSSALLSPPKETSITEYAATISSQSRLQAIGSVKEALRNEPGNEAYWLILGDLTFSTSLKLAQHAYVRAIEAAPRSPVGWTNLGLLYLHHQDVELANECFIKAQTLDPDYPAAWVGQALIARHYTDVRASRVLLEHAVSLSSGGELEADYGLANAVLTSSTNESLFAASFALTSYLAKRPKDFDALHISSLICERLGQKQQAIERIQLATHLLEERYEATEDPNIARMYGVAMANLGRIRLSSGEYKGALEALDAATGLLDDDDDDKVDEKDGDQADKPESADPQEDGDLSRQDLSQAKLQALLCVALSHFFLGQLDKATSAIEEALTFSNSSTSSLDSSSRLGLVVQQCKLLFAGNPDSQGGRGAEEGVKAKLLSTFAEDGGHIASILTLNVLGLATDDPDLVDATVGELESALLNPSSRGMSDNVSTIVRVLVAAKGYLARAQQQKDSPGADHNAQGLKKIHETIQSFTSHQQARKDLRSVFELHLMYLEESTRLNPSPSQEEEEEEETKSQILAYTSLTADMFNSYSGIHESIESCRARLERVLARLKGIYGKELGESVRLTARSYRALAILDEPWNTTATEGVAC